LEESDPLAAVEYGNALATQKTDENLARFTAADEPIEAIIADSMDYYFSGSFDVAIDVVKSGSQNAKLRRDIADSSRAFREFAERGWLEKLVERGCTHPIIFLTAYADVPLAVSAMKYGAVDLIQKPFSEQTLLDIVWRAINSHQEAWRSAEFAQNVQARLDLLSPRERDVLSLVVGGKPTKQIASILGLSHKTIDNHRASILDKMNADGVVDLVRLTLLADPSFRKHEYA
jgi:FixJ family two-component response regulator